MKMFILALVLILSFKFVWSVYNRENYDSIYEQKEPEEHRFW